MSLQYLTSASYVIIAELENAINLCSPSLWICTPEIDAFFVSRKKQQRSIVHDVAKNHYSPWNMERQSGQPAQFKHPPPFDVDQDLAVLYFSSGTTGLPKVVMVTHYSASAFLYQYR